MDTRLPTTVALLEDLSTPEHVVANLPLYTTSEVLALIRRAGYDSSARSRALSFPLGAQGTDPLAVASALLGLDDLPESTLVVLVDFSASPAGSDPAFNRALAAHPSMCPALLLEHVRRMRHSALRHARGAVAAPEPDPRPPVLSLVEIEALSHRHATALCAQAALATNVELLFTERIALGLELLELLWDLEPAVHRLFCELAPLTLDPRALELLDELEPTLSHRDRVFALYRSRLAAAIAGAHLS